jgi:hypothetical protein
VDPLSDANSALHRVDEKEGRVMSTSGSTKAAENNVGIGDSLSNSYNTAASGVASSELPFLQNEMTNPQGFGQQTVNQMQTQGGQATAGALGAGKEAATLNASRTGNTAAVPGVIDATTQQAMRQQSNNVLGIDQANAQAKLQQQQAGVSGLEKMYGTDVGAALQSLGLSNQAIGDWTGSKNAQTNADLGWLNAANQGAKTGNAIEGG